MSLRNYLKNDLGLSHFEQTEVLARAKQSSAAKFHKSRIGALRITLSIVGGFAVFFLARFVLTRWVGGSPLIENIIAGGAAGITASLLAIRSIRPQVYAVLRERGHNVCPKCGYLRKGLEDTAPCPECSTTISAPPAP